MGVVHQEESPSGLEDLGVSRSQHSVSCFRGYPGIEGYYADVRGPLMDTVAHARNQD